LVPKELHLCKQHWRESVPDYEGIVRTARRLCAKNADLFSAIYHPPREPLGRPSFEFNGPEDYIEHGSINVILDSVPKWLAGRRATRSLKLAQSTIRRHNLVLRFFLQVANDALLQTYFGAAFDARYVTDSGGESAFFNLLYGEEQLARQTAALCAQLSHVVPLMADVPVETILKVRREEPDAFQSYKSTLSRIVRDYAAKDKSVGVAEAKEIYLDLLKPQLDALQVQAANLRRTQLKKGILKVAASSALIGLGIYSGILPSQLTDLAKAIGGFSVAKDLAETLSALEKNPTEIRNHNLYFLLRLRQG
jgi:hypothetical protein